MPRRRARDQARRIVRFGPWHPPARYWRGSEPEWDLVADSATGRRALVGEAWFSARPAAASTLRREASRLETRPVPGPLAGRELVRALFVPAVARGTPRVFGSVHIATLADLVR